VISYSEDDICAFVDISNTLPFPFKSVNFTPSQVSIHVTKSSCGLIYKRAVPQISPSQRPLLHPSPSSIGLTMVDALKLTKSRETSNFDLTSIDFDNIDVHDDKYLLAFFHGDILFFLPYVALKVPSTYGRSMDGIYKMCDDHP